MRSTLTRIATGVGPGLAALLAEETSCPETSRVKSFAVSSLSWSSSGNSLRARALNKRATTTAKRNLLRVGRPEKVTSDLYRELAANSTAFG